MLQPSCKKPSALICELVGLLFQIAVQHEILKGSTQYCITGFLSGGLGWKEMMVTKGKTAIGDKKKAI